MSSVEIPKIGTHLERGPKQADHLGTHGLTINEVDLLGADTTGITAVPDPEIVAQLSHGTIPDGLQRDDVEDYDVDGNIVAELVRAEVVVRAPSLESLVHGPEVGMGGDPRDEVPRGAEIGLFETGSLRSRWWCVSS